MFGTMRPVRAAGLWSLLILMGSVLPERAASARQDVGVVVEGHVVDAETEAPLAGAHVFLEGSTYGAVTDGEGAFRMTNLPRGSYTLIVSMVGYEVAALSLRLGGAPTETLRIALPTRVLELDQLEVVGQRRPDEGEGEGRVFDASYVPLAEFTRHFIGQSKYAQDTRLLNPQMLLFAQTDEGFVAKSRGALLVENLALGYLMTYVLDEFAVEKDVVRYRGQVGFKELEPRNRRERRRWHRARAEVYEGSLRHFLHSLATGEHEDRFELYRVAQPTPFEYIDLERMGRETIPGEPIAARSILVTGTEPETYRLQFDQYVCVIYLGETQRMASTYPGARSGERIQRQEVSWITIDPEARFTTGAVFDADGRLHDPYAVHVYGVMGDQRMADFLPWDYLP